MSNDIAPEAFERMKALCEAVANSRYGADMHVNHFAEARAIMALLAPVDGDLVEARKLAADWCTRDDIDQADYLAGNLDSSALVQGHLAAIKRGRQLERGGE